MPDLTRRTAIAAASLATLAAALPALAQAPSNGAAWDLTDLFPDDAAWDAARKQALATARRHLSEVRPATGRGGGEIDFEGRVENVEAALASDANNRFIDRIVIHSARKGKWTPPAERVEVFWTGSDAPAVPV